jgi:hypothetical protein
MSDTNPEHRAEYAYSFDDKNKTLLLAISHPTFIAKGKVAPIIKNVIIPQLSAIGSDNEPTIESVKRSTCLTFRNIESNAVFTPKGKSASVNVGTWLENTFGAKKVVEELAPNAEAVPGVVDSTSIVPQLSEGSLAARSFAKNFDQGQTSGNMGGQAAAIASYLSENNIPPEKAAELAMGIMGIIRKPSHTSRPGKDESETALVVRS